MSASKLISEERLVRLSELVNSGDRLPVWGEARDLIAAARLAHELERELAEAERHRANYQEWAERAEALLHLILQHDIDREGDVLGADLGERVRAFLNTDDAEVLRG